MKQKIYHTIVGDYFFPGARLPARLGGKHHYWTGELMRLKRPIKPFHLWYGAPNWLRITGGIGAAAGGGATIYYLSDED